MLRILVTGATGFIGLEVAHLLATRGVRARLMVFRPHRAALLDGLGADVVAGDLADEASLARAVAGMDAVIHLAGRATFEPYHVVAPTLVHGTRALARAAVAAGVRTFVHAGSTLVYDGRTVPVDASTPAHPWSGYGRAKLDAELSLGAIAAGTGMRVGSLRLPHVYGARDTMFALVRRGIVVSPGRGDNLFSHLHVADAAALLVAAAERGWQGISPVADDCAVTWREFVYVLRASAARVPGMRVREMRIPAPIARVGSGVLALASRLRGRPTLMTPAGVAAWNRPLVVAPGLLWGELGLGPRFPTVHGGIPASLSEAVPDGWRHPIEDHRERPPRAHR